MHGQLNITGFDRERFEVPEDPGYLGTANGNVVSDTFDVWIMAEWRSRDCLRVAALRDCQVAPISR